MNFISYSFFIKIIYLFNFLMVHSHNNVVNNMHFQAGDVLADTYIQVNFINMAGK